MEQSSLGSCRYVVAKVLLSSSRIVIEGMKKVARAHLFSTSRMPIAISRSVTNQNLFHNIAVSFHVSYWFNVALFDIL